MVGGLRCPHLPNCSKSNLHPASYTVLIDPWELTCFRFQVPHETWSLLITLAHEERGTGHEVTRIRSWDVTELWTCYSLRGSLAFEASSMTCSKRQILALICLRPFQVHPNICLLTGGLEYDLEVAEASFFLPSLFVLRIRTPYHIQGIQKSQRKIPNYEAGPRLKSRRVQLIISKSTRSLLSLGR